MIADDDSDAEALILFADGHFCFCGEWCDCTPEPCSHCGDDDAQDEPGDGAEIA